MPFFEGAIGSVINDSIFNDVKGDQVNFKGNDNHFGPTNHGDNISGTFHGSNVGGKGNTNTVNNNSLRPGDQTGEDQDLEAKIAAVRRQIEVKRAQQRRDKLAAELAAAERELASINDSSN